MAEGPQFRRPEDPREIDELATPGARESESLAQNQGSEPPIDPPIRPSPVPRQHENPDQIVVNDDPGASASGYVSMLAKGQIGEIDPSATPHRNIPMAREIPPAVVPENMPPKLDPMRLPGPRPKPRRPWWWRIPTACYVVAAGLLLLGLWASVATACIFMQGNYLPYFEWDNDGDQLLAMLLLLCLPTAIILGMIGLYIKERLTR